MGESVLMFYPMQNILWPSAASHTRALALGFELSQGICLVPSAMPTVSSLFDWSPSGAH